MSEHPLSLTRRSFVFGISVIAGMVVLSELPLHAQALSDSSNTAPEMTVWVVIEPSDAVTIRVARSEMGQGTLTGLLMLVAEELECDWSHVRPEFVSPSENLARGNAWGSMTTAASYGIRTSQDYLRIAGAQARMMLIAEAASRWRVPEGECSASKSVIRHTASGRSLRFGEVAAAAAQRPVPPNVALKKPEKWTLIGSSERRFDTPDKVLGRAIYASDVRLPGMLYSAVRACPAFGGKRISFQADAITGMTGVRHVLPVGDDAVAVLADTWWDAHQALQLLPIVWDESASVHLNTAGIIADCTQALDATEIAKGRQAGDFTKALSNAHSSIELVFHAPYLAHVTMEPQTCTARVTKDGAEVWAPTQDGERTLQTVAKALSLDPKNVVVNKCLLGGGFGRRGIAQDWAVRAVQIARQVDVPVKMQWSREEDVRRDVCRPIAVAKQTASFDANRRLTGWKVRLAGPSIYASIAPERLVNGQDLDMMSAFQIEDMPYEAPNLDVGYAMRNSPIPVGFWRGTNHSQNGFFRECFVDEMAHSIDTDPFQFRRTLLANSPRSLRVLEAVAERSGWGRAPAGVHQGIAIVECYDSVCAEVVDLSVDEKGRITIHRVFAGIDSAYIVNKACVVAQTEGCIAWALAATMTGEITHTRGRVDQSNFHNYPALRMFEMPPVETILLASGDRFLNRWGGIGEPAATPLAPAIANAVFSATGKRIRSLPLKNHGLRLA
jgi:isoquinoline 1-oxidoreductase beta subunit